MYDGTVGYISGGTAKNPGNDRVAQAWLIKYVKKIFDYINVFNSNNYETRPKTKFYNMLIYAGYPIKNN